MLQAISIIIAALSVAVAAWSAVFGVHAWRRQLIGGKKAEVAEKALTAIYEAREIVQAARSPMSYSNEGSTRQREEGETEDQRRYRDSLYAPAERLNREREFFASTNASRYRLMAYFGPEAAVPFETVYRIRNRVLISVNMLVRTSDRDLRRPEDIAAREKYENDIWGVGDADDQIKQELDRAVAQLETICRPALTDAPEPPGASFWRAVRSGSRTRALWLQRKARKWWRRN
jgi:hypothetical protein